MKRLALIGLATVLFAVGAVLLWRGLIPSESARAARVAHDFLEADRTNDTTRERALLTRRAAERSDIWLTPGKRGTSMGVATGDAIIDGDRARVALDAPKDASGVGATELLLRREDGEWRVSGTRIRLAPGSEDVTLDFENPEAFGGEAMRAAGQAMAGQMENAGRALGQAMGGFIRGMAESMSAPSPAPATP